MAIRDVCGFSGHTGETGGRGGKYGKEVAASVLFRFLFVFHLDTVGF